MRQIRVKIKDRGYPIYIDNDSLVTIGHLAHLHELRPSLAIITDDNVKSLYATKVVESLRTAGFKPQVYSVPAGESSKSLAVVEKLIGELLRAGYSRETTIFALGGGVVGDLAGFVAATYLRGVKYVQVPTTLLAQVDSSVGGKVGVNHELGKNLIGAFLQPQFVLIDPTVLSSLNGRERRAGAAEVIKYGLIRDQRFFKSLEIRLETLFDLTDLEFVNSTITRCCRIKAEVVERDEKETNLRRILNFGHTIGHALESVTEYSYFRHGEAVAWGMQAAAYLSHLSAQLQIDDVERVANIVKRLKLPIVPAGLGDEKLLKAIRRDKKQTTTGLHWVMLNRIGDAFITVKVENQLVQDTFSWLLKK